MRALGVSGGWLFYEHAGSAVAVSLETGDNTDVFSIKDIPSDVVWTKSPGNGVERHATLVARSVFAVSIAASIDPLKTFRIPNEVRDTARQAALWQEIYQREVELPLVASVTSMVPPHSVQVAAQRALDHDLPPYARARAEQLASGAVIPSRLVQQMHTFFARHGRDEVGEATWLAWGGGPGREWATKVARSADDGASTLNEKLADAETVDYDTLRLLPRAFAAISSPHTVECDGNGDCSCGGSPSSSSYPSKRALTYMSLGGDVGRSWANRVLRRLENKALIAAPPAAEDPEVEAVAPEETEDPDFGNANEPHVFIAVKIAPEFCLYCLQDENNEVHRNDAVNYWHGDLDPEDSHYFDEDVSNPEKCAICKNPANHDLHKQAALAAYYKDKEHFDKVVAETQEYWAKKQAEGGEAPVAPVVSAAERFGVDWVETEPDAELEELYLRALAIDDDMEQVFWARRGDEDSDPLTYYLAHTDDDKMTVDQVYVTDGELLYHYDPTVRGWIQGGAGGPDQLYEVDDQTALEVLRTLSMYPQQQVNLREMYPGEALLMEESLPYLAQQDGEMLDRVTIVAGAHHHLFIDEPGYTPQERAQNAKQQVRDANGRFAKSGSRVAIGPQNRLGTIGKINPETQQVEVTYDEGDSEWVDAKQAKILSDSAEKKTDAPAQPTIPASDIAKIEGKPRATGRTPSATLPMMLPPMDAEAIKAVIDNYPNFIEKERAGAAARQAGQDANDDASRKRADDEQKRATADYERRVRKIHGQGKSARDWVDRIYNKVLPGYKRKPKNPLTAAGQPITDPAQSDVAPIYLAEVDPVEKTSVLELLAMVPASTEGTDPQLLRYTANGWINDAEMLRKIKSTSPPPIVSLDEATYTATLEQVKQFYTTPEGKAEAEQEAKDAQSVAASAYGEYGELLAAGIPGIADTPSDISATEKLKRYWMTGEGGTAKIRWNTPGDMTRCMRHLNKYMPKPGMAEGYCAKLHHEMTGEWPGDRKNIGRRGAGFGTRVLNASLLSSREVIEFSALIARGQVQDPVLDVPQQATDVPQVLSGAPFLIPILAPIGVKSGDGRHFAPLSLTTRDLPLPLMWQIKTSEGHDESVIVGRIDSIDRSEDGSLINARGVFDVGPYGQEAERLVRHKFLRGVSVDLDEFEATAKAANELADRMDDDTENGLVRIAADDMTVTNGRVMGATLVAKPAFQQCTIEIPEELEEETMVADGTYIGTPTTETETEEMVRSALTAAGVPLHPPAEWFADPGLRQETPLTVLDDGRVYGHIATWNTDHVGLPFSTRPPRSRSQYAYFHTGVLRTAEGDDVPVGQITLAGGHAPLEANAQMAVKHYDDTASAWCDVHAGEDAYGIWVAGALRPSVTGDQIRAIRASAPSGDWRPISGRLEMVAVCQVNVPGFPVTRARVASGQVYALIAAGTSYLNRVRAESGEQGMSGLLERVEALEAPQREALAAAREAALARISPAREEHNARLAEARAAALSRFERTARPEVVAARERFAALREGEDLFRDIGADKRKDMAKKGSAMPDGSFPISTVGDLKNAIRAYGRTSSDKKAAVRRHIKKRARALGKTDLIPESWASLTTPVQDVAGEISDLMQRMSLIADGALVPIILRTSDETLDHLSLLAAGGHYPDGTPWNPGNHPRDDKGRFRQVIAELKSDLEGEVGTEQAVEGLKEVEIQANQGDMDAAQQAAGDVLDLVDQLAKNTEDVDTVKTLREGYGNLAEAVANLPLVFGDLNQKYRFSDLPPELKGLIEDLTKRGESLLQPEDMSKAGGKLKEFMAGGDVLSQPEISAELSRLLRFLI